jgi:hypothetical protein
MVDSSYVEYLDQCMFFVLVITIRSRDDKFQLHKYQNDDRSHPSDLLCFRPSEMKGIIVFPSPPFFNIYTDHHVARYTINKLSTEVLLDIFSHINN